MISQPAARSRAHASSTAGSSSNSVTVAGGYGFPSRTMARLMTPSLSKKTARFIDTSRQSLDAFPFCLRHLQAGVRNEQVPDHTLESLGMGRDVRRIDGWDND